MNVQPWPDHLLSLEEWDELPADRSHHLELVEGVLVVAPRPAPQHQIAMTNLTSALNRQLPGTLTATPDTEIIIDTTFPPTVRAPDVLVMSSSLYESNPPRINADEVLLAVEIVSPGTGRRDRIVKAAEYAGAGIPYYWVIDLTPPASLTTLTPVGREYEITDKATSSITLSEPATITVDVSRLTRPDYLW